MAITKLGIGTPTKGLMEARTAYSLATAMMNLRVTVQPFLGLGCYIHINRNILVNQALDFGCSHLLMVDSDVVFNHDAITRLMQHEVDIVGARYNKCILPIECTVKADISSLTAVPFVPAGLLLVNTDVFKKIGKPYFSFDERSDCEDLYFCNKAIDAGYKVYCDPTIQVGHLGTAVF